MRRLESLLPLWPGDRWTQKPWPQSVQKRAARMHIVPQPGQDLCVEAMSKPHSAQKRPPPKAAWQLGQAMPALALPPPDEATDGEPRSADGCSPLPPQASQCCVRGFQQSSQTVFWQLRHSW